MTDDELPNIGEETVSVESVGDYMVNLDIDRLPNGTVAIDYMEDEERPAPRLIVRATDISVDLVHEESGEYNERVYAITVEEPSDFVDTE